MADRRTDRQIIAERKFGDVQFLIGAGASMKWLEMYTGDRLVAAFRDFDADEVIASPDHKHFLALSTNSKSAYAYAIFDRNGRVEASLPHGGDLHYCNRTSWGVGEWIDLKKLQAVFSVEKNQMTTPATEYLQASVRGCDGKRVILARAPAPPLKYSPDAIKSAPIQPTTVAANEVVVTGTRIAAPGNNGIDRSSAFIGATIANLRALDPTFGARTLTLTDGRRSVAPAAGFAPAASTAHTTIKVINLPTAWKDAPLTQRNYPCKPGILNCDSSDLLAGNPDGSTALIASGVVGEFIALPASRRIFSCEYSNLTEYKWQVRVPIILDLDGHRTELSAHAGPLRVCARTGSGDEVLMVYTVVRDSKRLALARVYDAKGAMLVESSFENGGELAFSAGGQKYSTKVPAP